MYATLTALALIFVLAIITAFGAVCLKKGSATISMNPIKLLRNRYLLLGVLLYLLPTPLYFTAVKMVNISIVYPMTSLAYVWVALLSTKFLNEKMNKHKWLGILCIMTGIVLIACAKI